MSLAKAIQKEMIRQSYEELADVHEQVKAGVPVGERRAVIYTFVPGNLSELLRYVFDGVMVYPEITALQRGVRKKSQEQIKVAEDAGFNRQICSYVKCEIGGYFSGNLSPVSTDERATIPPPDILFLSYTGCFMFPKWFEILKGLYNAADVVLHTPFLDRGFVTREKVDYLVSQLRRDTIPKLETLTGRKYDEDKLRAALAKSAEAEDHWVDVLHMAKRRPAPFDAFFDAVYYMAPLFGGYRGSAECVEYYRRLKEELRGSEAKAGARDESFRLVAEGTPPWTHFSEFREMFEKEGGVFVASTYSKVGGIYDLGFRHDPERPLESLAEYSLGCYTNLSLPARLNLLRRYVEEYSADAVVVSSSKSCDSFSVGQPLLVAKLRESGISGVLLETDLVDGRTWQQHSLKTRIKSFFETLKMGN